MEEVDRVMLEEATLFQKLNKSLSCKKKFHYMYFTWYIRLSASDEKKECKPRFFRISCMLSLSFFYFQLGFFHCFLSFPKPGFKTKFLSYPNGGFMTEMASR